MHDGLEAAGRDPALGLRVDGPPWRQIAGHIPLVHLRRVELREVRLDQNDFLAELDQL